MRYDTYFSTEFGIKNNGTSLTYFEQKRKNNNDFVLRNPN